MSTDYAAKERAFLDSLKDDTGRDLGEWMRAIAEAGLPHRNDTIDWLRQQGFPFSRASWMERIHHNGGRPIYADAGARPPATRRAAKPTPPVATTDRAAAQAASARAATANGDPGAGVPARAATASGQAVEATPARIGSDAQATAHDAWLDKAALAAHLASAKAFRPLAQHLIAAVERAIPSLGIRAADGLLMLCAPAPFAVILPTARDIRLGLDAGDAALGPHMLRARLPAAPAAFVHTIVLDDARQVNPDLVAVVEAAQRRAAGKA